jgi:predicted RNA-binding Zn-ribbon protein involved in translation (DUF1610 family)
MKTIKFKCEFCGKKIKLQLWIEEQFSYRPVKFMCPHCGYASGIARWNARVSR